MSKKKAISVEGGQATQGRRQVKEGSMGSEKIL